MSKTWMEAGWPVVRIQDIGRLCGGGTPSRKRPEYFNGSIPWITGQDIPENQVVNILSAREYISAQAVQESTTRVVPAGAVLVSTRVSIGKTAVASCPISFSQDVTAIILHSDLISLSFYVAYFIQSRRRELLKKNQGSTIVGVTRDSLALQQIPLPPLSEQKRIVEILQEAEELRRLRAEAEMKTAELIPAIYHDLFIAPEKRKTWKHTTVAEIAADKKNAIRTGPFGSDLLHSEFVDSGIPVLGIDNAVTNRFQWAERRYITPQKYSDLIRFRVYPGDVMITIMGTVGRVAIAPQGLPESISTKHLCVITPQENIILPSFLWATLLYDQRVRAQTRAVAKGAIMEGWNSKIIRSLKFRLPPLKLQKEFEAQVQEILEIEEQLLASPLDRALNDSLSAHAFSGQLTAEWREANKDQLQLEAVERDATLKMQGITSTKPLQAKTKDFEVVVKLRMDGIYSDLNKEQLQLLRDIKQMIEEEDSTLYFSAKTISEYLAEGSLRRNPQAIEGHLSVLAARGLVIPVSLEESQASTGEIVFGNCYRLPLAAPDSSKEEAELQASDYTRLSELHRLADRLQRERPL